ncbi:hypothetical protein BCON_0362g00070 [Botryotinia convoluta]|uniref:2EXR domain-containing protein n=1 Tax=Botryotinia convoluta TaxID=54673 RepID=A0A4Z1HG93_9HELO|nr:hypothetical protein BCON_0362g00070 [Botryotinia convoluta]
MAKRKPILTVMEMEKELGYKIDDLNHPDNCVKRFYSDLRPVLDNVYERTKKEFEEHEKQRFRKDTMLEKDIPGFDGFYIIARGQDTVTFTRRTHAGFYSFVVDIHYSFGLSLPLLFTKNEIFEAMTIAKLRPDTTCGLGPMFSKLPKELRDKIYTFAFPRREWKVADVDGLDELNFARGIGDLSGFYFPLSSLTVLRVNKQMRQEALPFAYRRTVFHVDDMDDLVKFLISIGEIGRDNIKSLELAWQSRSDFERQWAEAPDPNENSLTLPTLHAAKCVQLLKQCKSLSFLRLCFEKDLILGMSSLAYKTDLGICELSSVRGIERVEICDLGYEPLEQCGFVKWLKEAMESSKDRG